MGGLGPKMALWLQSLFSANKLIRYGVYALVFFVLIIVEGNLTGQTVY